MKFEQRTSCVRQLGSACLSSRDKVGIEASIQERALGHHFGPSPLFRHCLKPRVSKGTTKTRITTPELVEVYSSEGRDLTEVVAGDDVVFYSDAFVGKVLPSHDSEPKPSRRIRRVKKKRKQSGKLSAESFFDKSQPAELATMSKIPRFE